MGKSELEAAASRLRTVAKQAYLTEDSKIKANLRDTPLLAEYVSTVNQYRPDACADALGDLATELDKLAKRAEAPPVTLTPTEKTYSLRSVGYVETSLAYLGRYTERSPPIRAKVSEVEKAVSSLKAAVVADPPLPRSRLTSTSRHARIRESHSARRRGRRR